MLRSPGPRQKPEEPRLSSGSPLEPAAEVPAPPHPTQVWISPLSWSLKSGQASLQAPLCPALCPLRGFLFVGSPASQLAQQKLLFFLLRFLWAFCPVQVQLRCLCLQEALPGSRKGRGHLLVSTTLRAGWSPQHECLLIAGSLTGQPGTLSDPGGQSGTRKAPERGRFQKDPRRLLLCHAPHLNAVGNVVDYEDCPTVLVAREGHLKCEHLHLPPGLGPSLLPVDRFAGGTLQASILGQGRRSWTELVALRGHPGQPPC